MENKIHIADAGVLGIFFTDANVTPYQQGENLGLDIKVNNRINEKGQLEVAISVLGFVQSSDNKSVLGGRCVTVFYIVSPDKSLFNPQLNDKTKEVLSRFIYSAIDHLRVSLHTESEKLNLKCALVPLWSFDSIKELVPKIWIASLN